MRVLQPETQVQDCGKCVMQSRCWAKDIRAEHIISNLLVCRIHRGYEVDKSVKLLLEMINPALLTFAAHAIKGTRIDLETALADMRSETVRVLTNTYGFGDVSYPLHYLFGKPNGNIRRHANSYAKKTRLFDEHVVLSGGRHQSDSFEDDATETVYIEEKSTTDETDLAREIIEDGVTLSLQEYRIMKFCLDTVGISKSPINALHSHLAEKMGITKAKSARIFAEAGKKIADEVKRRNA